MTKLRIILAATLMLATLASQAEDLLLDRIIAVVNDDVVLQSEVDLELGALQLQARQSGQALPRLSILRERILERLILDKLQIQRAKQLGISIDEETLNRTLNSIARNNNMDLFAFRQALTREGMEYQQFRNNIRNELTISRLKSQQIERSVNVSNREIDSFLKRQQSDGSETSYNLSHILIGVPEGASTEQIQQAAVRVDYVLEQLQQGADFAKLAATYSSGTKALEGGKIGWRKAGELPEMFADALNGLQPGETTAALRTVNGFHLLRVDEVQTEQPRLATETRARHILLRDNQDQSNNEDNQTKITQLRERLLQGEAFEDLAREFSDDANSAANGGELPWYRPGEMVPEFEKVAAGLPLAKPSEPFRSNFGWHLLEVLERRDFNPDRENRRAKAEETLRKARTDEEYELWLRKLRAEAYVEIRDAV